MIPKALFFICLEFLLFFPGQATPTPAWLSNPFFWKHLREDGTLFLQLDLGGISSHPTFNQRVFLSYHLKSDNGESAWRITPGKGWIAPGNLNRIAIKLFELPTRSHRIEDFGYFSMGKVDFKETIKFEDKAGWIYRFENGQIEQIQDLKGNKLFFVTEGGWIREIRDEIMGSSRKIMEVVYDDHNKPISVQVGQQRSTLQYHDGKLVRLIVESVPRLIYQFGYTNNLLTSIRISNGENIEIRWEEGKTLADSNQLSDHKRLPRYRVSSVNEVSYASGFTKDGLVFVSVQNEKRESISINPGTRKITIKTFDGKEKKVQLP